jgi:hypothetical protein
MNGKSNLSWRIGMVMMFLCTALVLTVLPAAADYSADKELTQKYSGTITGDMNYTIGDSYYSPKMWSNNTGNLYTASLPQAIPAAGTSVVKARLYVYWTWSYNADESSGVIPEMNVTFDGTSFIAPNSNYNDTKGSDPYNYPSGTYCYDVTNLINPSSAVDHIVTVHNNHDSDEKWSFNIQAVGLVVAYNDSSSNTQKDYWIDEGCDMTYTKWNATTESWEYGYDPEETTCTAHFSNVNNNNVNSATLITVAPAAGTIYNRLYFNNNYWDGIWDGSPRDSNFSWDITNVANYLNSGENLVKFRNGLENSNHSTEGQMQAANAFLLVTH